MGDASALDRFVAAQEAAHDQALAEIRQEAKRGHWMWFIFPQLAGLGHSAMARRYAIASLAEARAYLAHPLLGPRYQACVAALQALKRKDAQDLFGPVDALKLRSSLTLFARASADPAITAALTDWFGDEDPATLCLLEQAAARP
ncbi:DUF1810 domain-containing protein [Novosphingobium rosa]|uniref:DUF1810 domain-containing protein n=1 Tax=Novosphingobium rosa TaxID=76978 RepID=UPI00082CB093|nr:DUF1810 domain-containing protein [Novosphingobium rosa]